MVLKPAESENLPLNIFQMSFFPPQGEQFLLTFNKEDNFLPYATTSFFKDNLWICDLWYSTSEPLNKLSVVCIFM